jgi:hypothetical protein
MGGGVINVTPRPLYSQERHSAHFLRGAENFFLTGIRSQHRPAGSEPQYRLIYRGPHKNEVATVVLILCFDGLKMTT